MSINYKAPREGEKSSIDGTTSDQVNTSYWIKKALIDIKPEQFFTPMAKSENIPKHFGKAIRVYHYIPLLDDRNINDQGIDATGKKSKDGNLWGSSTDIGTITDKLPSLTEEGGLVNRVGFTREMITGKIARFGFFYDFTEEAYVHDSDPEFLKHLARESIRGANSIYEKLLEIDLLNGANTVVFAGAATSMDQLAGEEIDDGQGATLPVGVVTYENLSRLDQKLTDADASRHLTMITGSTKVDTKVIPSCRVAYVGPELKSLLRKMTDPFGDKAFIEVQHYAHQGTIHANEIGSIDGFRFIEVPKLSKWAGKGAKATKNKGYRTTDVKGTPHYDVFPILVVTSESFATLSFNSATGGAKFDIITKMPGKQTADGYNDPYGEKGFSSTKFYYGTLILHPNRIGLIKTVAPI